MIFSKEVLQPYLPRKMNLPGMEIDEVKQFTRGSSRETWFLTYHSPKGGGALVLRRDMPDGSIIPGQLDREFAIYDALAKTDVPVAKPLWWENDPEVLQGGQPFYVREHVEGSWELPGYAGSDPALDDMRIAISKEHLRALAKVHAVDWRALGIDKLLPAPASPESAARNIIDNFQARIEAQGGEAIPVLAEALEWLRERAPPAARVSLCKGTNGLGEEVFRDGKIVAMSDWEEATLGDGASDFAYCQNLVPEIERNGVKLWGLAQALDYYESVSGFRILPATVHYYHLIRALSMIEFGSHTAIAIMQGHSGNPRKGFTATEVIHIAKRMLASAMGLMPPIPPARFYDMIDME